MIYNGYGGGGVTAYIPFRALRLTTLASAICFYFYQAAPNTETLFHGK